MSKFAKLFERNGQQVLVTKGEDSEGNPALVFRFESNVSEHSIELAVGYSGPSKKVAEALDKAFDAIDEDAAFEMRNGAPGVDL